MSDQSVLLSRAFVDAIKAFLEGVQDRQWENAELCERANVLEFKLRNRDHE